MRAVDSDVGISEFLGSHNPFTAIVKANVSDFVVNEVTQDGTVVQLTSTALPEVRENNSINPVTGSDEAGRSVALKAPQNDDEWNAACVELEKKLAGSDVGDKSVSASIRGFACPQPPPLDSSTDLNSEGKRPASVEPGTSPGDPEASATAALVLPPISEKATRKAVHQWIACVLPGYVTDTISTGDESGRIRLRRMNECRPWKRKRTEGGGRSDAPSSETNRDAVLANTYDPREVGPRGNSRGFGGGSRGGARHPHFVDRRTYVQFVLWKQGRDTVNALSELASRLRLKTDDLSHAGTKDKRGITTQRIRVRGIPLTRLVQVNRSFLGHRGQNRMVMGNFEVLPKKIGKLGLGDLGGNRFTLALRELDLRDPGAVANIMSAVSSVRERGFVNYFGLQRFGSGAYGTHTVGFSVLRGNFAEACSRLLTPLVIQGVADGKEELRDDRRRTDESLRAFANGTMTAKELLGKLPKWMNVERSVALGFAHDEERESKHDPKAAFSKVPRTMRKMYGHAVQSYIWNVMATERIRASQTKYAIEGDLVLSEEGVETQGDAAEACQPPTANVSKWPRKVCLSASTPVRAVSAEEERKETIPIDNVLLPMIGSRVPIPGTKPGNAARDILEKEKLDLAQVPQEYDMNGTYRWLIARPVDVSANIVCYNERPERIIASKVDAVLGLSREDRPRGLRGNHVDCERGQSLPDKTGVEQKEEQNGTEVVGDTTDTSKTAGKFSALVISFTLSVAEYATILVRELTKQDSSIESQKRQQQGALERENEMTNIIKSVDEDEHSKKAVTRSKHPTCDPDSKNDMTLEVVKSADQMHSAETGGEE